MGCSGFFWENDTLFMSYHAYTAPTGDALLNIKPVYLDSEDWLTMDPKKGTIITGGQTIIHNSTHTQAKRQHTDIVKRFIYKNEKLKSEEQIYSILGKRCCGINTSKLPAGIYLKRNLTER
ncbi:MAG: hypothetical protein JW915_06985 [Chitinispirillaceae bacterium]|nr:hypothetical protein [Chitinispirillaceae bacterium]